MASQTVIRRFATSLQSLHKLNPFPSTLKLYDPYSNPVVNTYNNDIKQIKLKLDQLEKRVLILEKKFLALEIFVTKINS
jgi:hypothetical protein